MRFRMWFFSFFFVLSLLWLCWGFSRSSQVASDLLKTPSKTETEEAATTIGVGIGTGINYTIVACTGIPLALLFGLLAWRNQVGLRTERHHREQLAAQERQLHALQQAAMASTAQAAIQYAGIRQVQQPSSALPAPDPALQAKFQTARELIEDKEYNAARAILRKIDDPKARDWLEKIDKLDPQ